jgi:cysteinyl-tRNA synthetase
MLQVEGKKMSKSLGNFFTVRDLLDQGVPGEVIRFVMLSTHYRKPMDWTEKKREEAEKTLLGWKETIDLERDAVADLFAGDNPPPSILDALANDLNTSLALTEVRKIAKNAAATVQGKVELAEALSFLGFDYTHSWKITFGTSLDKTIGDRVDLEALELRLSEVRSKAMQTKNFDEVDQMKAILVDAGIEVRMSKDGVTLDVTPDFDPAKLEALK